MNEEIEKELSKGKLKQLKTWSDIVNVKKKKKQGFKSLKVSSAAWKQVEIFQQNCWKQQFGF